MSQTDQRYTANSLLRSLSGDDFELLKPHLTRVDLVRGQMLVAPNTPVEQVYFPEGGVVSIVSDMADVGRIEVGIFGREGVSATCLLLGTNRSPNYTVVRVDQATALRIDADRYLATIAESLSLRTMLLRYVQTALVQSAHTTATNASQRLEIRLARWLPMYQDRVDGDEFALTHKFIGMMISAQRSGVTVSLHILEGAGIIRSKRGRIIILDRGKLEQLAGSSYGTPEAEYRLLIGPLGSTLDVPAFES